MKFVEINAAKVPFDKTVFVKDDKDQFHAAKMIEEKKTPNGTLKTFELAQFDPANLTPLIVSNVVSVAVPK